MIIPMLNYYELKMTWLLVWANNQIQLSEILNENERKSAFVEARAEIEAAQDEAKLLTTHGQGSGYSVPRRAPESASADISYEQANTLDNALQQVRDTLLMLLRFTDEQTQQDTLKLQCKLGDIRRAESLDITDRLLQIAHDCQEIATHIITDRGRTND